MTSAGVAGVAGIWQKLRRRKVVPEFKAFFAGVEAEMAAQRARLAARPKDAPLVIEQLASLK